MTAPSQPLMRRTGPVPTPGPDEALVEVAGCGVCHTDLSFLFQGVRVRSALPLVLGHEVSGYVRAVGGSGDQTLIGRPVVVPAVLPCGECDLCRAGRRTICRRQIMPGNDRDGGFASHMVVPTRFLCPIPAAALARHEVWELAVVSDAVATPFQAVLRAEVGPDDLAVVVGAGGIGIHAVQIAAAAGATVIAVDVDAGKLEQARVAGARATVDASGRTAKDLRSRVRAEAETLGASPFRWQIFETSGTRSGQETAYGLLSYGASLAVVGFTMDKVEICLSNLMAFDAVARGNWGADPLVYPELLDWVGQGRIAIKPFVERYRLDAINEVFERAHRGELARRAVLVP
ncbi:MAG: 6-hydroxycyclohex-1-ene-1-carbonyl-CoA dehydrogenase [Gemmatimonadales bacterium]